MQGGQQRTEMRANAYVSAALRSPHVPKQGPEHGPWLVETPTEDAETLFRQALRQLEEK